MAPVARLIIKSTKQVHPKQPKVIDGFVKAPSKLNGQAAWPLSSQLHKGAEKAQTLMRGGLKKPANPQSSTLSHPSARPKLETQLRAKSTPKHSDVSHFGNPIKAASPAAKATVPKRVLHGELVSNSRTYANPGVSAAAVQPMPSMVASASHQKLERLLDEALTKADAHKQALKYHAARHFWQRQWFSGPRKIVFFACLLFVVVAASLFAWQRVPQLSMKVAGTQAHISPIVPSYKPDGFNLASPASAKSGIVTIKYKSTADPKQTYSIAQTGSNLTSSLVSQNVVPKGTSVQTSQVNGNTVYIYGQGNDAVWVNDNVLYKINNDAKLNSDQLINIVKGLSP